MLQTALNKKGTEYNFHAHLLQGDFNKTALAVESTVTPEAKARSVVSTNVCSSVLALIIIS